MAKEPDKISPETEDALSQLVERLKKLENGALDHVERAVILRRNVLKDQRSGEWEELVPNAQLVESSEACRNFVEMLAGRNVYEVTTPSAMQELGKTLATIPPDSPQSQLHTVRNMILEVVQAHAEELAPILDSYQKELNYLEKRTGCGPLAWAARAFGGPGRSPS